MENIKIDIVYLWVDGSDAVWQLKKRRYMADKADISIDCEGRYIDNEELKYSLRSVEKYAPWINNIFIVTDGHTPEWLDVSNSRVKIVNHKDILPDSCLPVFNSNAIEMGIVNIKGLSDYYLCANDDTLFARDTDKSFFVDEVGRPKCRFTLLSKKQYRNGLEHLTSYFSTIVSVNSKIKEDYKHNFCRLFPYHQIDIYSKASVLKCREIYSEWVNSTIHNRFRSSDDIQRHIFSLFSIVDGGGVAVVKSLFARRLDKIMVLLKFKKGVDSLFLSIASDGIGSKIAKYRPQLLCLNDGEDSTNRDRERVKSLLESMYPNKSKFEKQ